MGQLPNRPTLPRALCPGPQTLPQAPCPGPKHSIAFPLTYPSLDLALLCCLWAWFILPYTLYMATIYYTGVNKKPLAGLFRTDSFRTKIDHRQFQKFLLVIDSFGPNRCGKICAEVLSHLTNYDGELINQLTRTPESPLYRKHNAS